MSVQATLETKLQSQLQPTYFTVENESQLHAGPASESHFNLTVVSAEFDNLSAVKRHQKLYKMFAEELSDGVHALALHLYTQQEWSARAESSPLSPNCQGANK